MTEKLRRTWFCVIQFCTIPANFILTKLLKLTVTRPHNFSIAPGTLIVANHQSKMDPFLISYHVGVRNWAITVPIRYPVTHEYMTGKIITLFIKLFGGYNIGETPLQRLKGLALTRDLLKKKYSVVIFPEGKINYTAQEIATFKQGVEMLFSYECPVIFVRLTYLNHKDRFAFWKSHPRAAIEYSSLFPHHSSKAEKIDHMLKFFNIPT